MLTEGYYITDITDHNKNLLLRLTGLDGLNQWEIKVYRKSTANTYLIFAINGKWSFLKIYVDLDKRTVVNDAFHFNKNQENIIADILKRQKVAAKQLSSENVIFCYKNKASKHPFNGSHIRLTGYDTFGKYDCLMFQDGDIDHFRSVMCDSGSEIFEQIAWIYDVNRPGYDLARSGWTKLGRHWTGQIHD
jgi:hypothetical protein